MNLVKPSDLDAFVRRYRFAGGVIRLVRYRHRKRQLNVDVVLRVMTAMKSLSESAKPVKLHLRFVDVEECRFQKRPAKGLAKITEAKFGFFDGLVYANFDAWGLEPGERPQIFDFRGSDAFLGAKDLFAAEVAPSA
ncbi:hypothetical protein BH11PLA2_BH11PLA2_18750 [soil metagenome]